MEKLTCQNCGAPLDRSGKCQYCGTIHQIGREHVRIIRMGPAQTIESKTLVSQHMAEVMDAPDLAEYALEDLRNQLAEGLMGFMEIRTEFDPYSNVQIYRGTVRVVPPGVQF